MHARYHSQRGHPSMCVRIRPRKFSTIHNEAWNVDSLLVHWCNTKLRRTITCFQCYANIDFSKKPVAIHPCIDLWTTIEITVFILVAIKSAPTSHQSLILYSDQSSNSISIPSFIIYRSLPPSSSEHLFLFRKQPSLSSLLSSNPTN